MPKKNYINRINNSQGRSFFSHLFEIGLFVLLLGYFIFHNSRAPMVASAAFGIFSFVVFTIHNLKTHKFKIPLCFVWYFLFFVYAEASSFWAFNPYVTARYYLVIMVLMLLLFFFIPQYTDNIDQAEIILKVFVYFALINSLIQLIATPFGEWFSGTFGFNVGGNNVNQYGFVVMVASIVSFYFAYLKNQKLYYLYTVLLFIFCIFSRSRKTVLLSIAGIALIIFLAFKKRKHFLHLFAVLFISVVTLIFLMENETLYNAVGFRFESFINHYIFNIEGSDSSLGLREYFIDFAKLLFDEKPLFGHGFASFSNLFGLESDVSWAVYAHNNYWQILADLGITGFIIYYWFYLFLAVKLIIKLFKEKDNPLPILAVSLLIVEFFVEWGFVSMTNFHALFSMLLIYICSFVSNSNRKYHYISDSKVR